MDGSAFLFLEEISGRGGLIMGRIWLWNIIMSISLLMGGIIGFLVGLDIQQQRQWDKGYQTCLIQLMNYRNTEGKPINVTEFIDQRELKRHQVALND